MERFLHGEVMTSPGRVKVEERKAFQAVSWKRYVIFNAVLFIILFNVP